MDNKIIVSIIVPLPRFNDYIREAIPHYYEKMNDGSFELIILPDFEETEILSKTLPIKVIPSGKTGPAEKRDLGAKHANGYLLAFTDDDAYPDNQWLTNALPLFKDKSVAAVGGPAVTPPDEKFWQRISGNVYSSFVTSAAYRKRYIKTGTINEDYDLPSVNLIVRKEIFERIGGFDSSFYPGEDTKFCLEIKKTGMKILYSPDVLVYHHRRALFPNHFAQIANYAVHRGYFAKVFPETSLKLPYFMPSIFLSGIVFGPLLSFFIPFLWPFYLAGVTIFFVLDIIFNLYRDPFESFMTIIGVFFHHIVYGFFFIKGLLFTKELKR